MGRGRALQKCNIAVTGQYREYPYAKVSGWISNLGGNASTSVNKATTHLVATEKAWKRQDANVQKALRLIKEEDIDIKIVSFDWLEDSVYNKSKKREGPYLWQKLDASSAKKDAAKKREERANQPRRDHVGMMAEVFQESTEGFVDPKEARKVQKEIEEERRVKKHMDEEEKKEKKEEERRKKAALFGHGAKKARNDIFTENYHIYTDDTGFKYDIVVTKVDTRHNRNERWALTFQIYESNSLPYTYAFNTQYAGPNKEAKNTIMVPLGSPFPPAFRMFKKVFKEKTHVEWDDRIGHAIERAKKEKRDRGLATGSEDLGSRKGVAVSVQEEKEKKEKEEKEFEVMPFEYHPPRFGPRGKIPKDKVPYGLIGEKNREIDVWMSGANGDGPDAPIDLTDGDAENANPAPKSVFDKELSEWVDENLDDLDPFDDPAANLAYIKETDARFASTNTAENSDLINQTDAQIDSTNDDELFDFGAMDQNDPADETQNGISFDQTDTSATQPPISFEFGPMDKTEAVAELQNEISIDLRPEDQMDEAVKPQQNTSFNQTDTNATQPPISFDLPSTVQESFEPGTQDVSDTQIAERAMGEFDEFANQPMPDTISMAMDKAADSSGTQDTLTTTTTPNMDLGSSVPSKPNDDEAANADNTHGNTTASTATPNFDLGSSTLSKRKNSPNAADTVEDVTGRETHKKTKRQNSQEDADEDEASVMAAEESFDAEDAYQIATQAIEDAIGDEGSVPGNMLRESDAVFPTKVSSSYALSAVAGEPTYNGGDDFAGVVFPDQATIDALMEGAGDGDMGLSGE